MAMSLRDLRKRSTRQVAESSQAVADAEAALAAAKAAHRAQKEQSAKLEKEAAEQLRQDMRTAESLLRTLERDAAGWLMAPPVSAWPGREVIRAARAVLHGGAAIQNLLAAFAAAAADPAAIGVLAGAVGSAEATVSRIAELLRHADDRSTLNAADSLEKELWRALLKHIRSVAGEDGSE